MVGSRRTRTGLLVEALTVVSSDRKVTTCGTVSNEEQVLQRNCVERDVPHLFRHSSQLCVFFYIAIFKIAFWSVEGGPLALSLLGNFFKTKRLDRLTTMHKQMQLRPSLYFNEATCKRKPISLLLEVGQPKVYLCLACSPTYYLHVHGKLCTEWSTHASYGLPTSTKPPCMGYLAQMLLSFLTH